VKKKRLDRALGSRRPHSLAGNNEANAAHSACPTKGTRTAWSGSRALPRDKRKQFREGIEWFWRFRPEVMELVDGPGRRRFSDQSLERTRSWTPVYSGFSPPKGGRT